MSNKKTFTNAAALPDEPTSEEVFSSMLEAEPSAAIDNNQPKKNPKKAGRKPSANKAFCLWLTPKSMEGAKVLAKVKDARLSLIIEEALAEYLAKPENARIIRKYKKAFSDDEGGNE